MALKHARRPNVRLLCLAYLIQVVVAVTMVDDIDSGLVYSNSGPSWWGSNFYNGQGKYVTGQTSSGRAYQFTWHETVGDGASVSYTFTGTHVSLISTICNSGYNTTVDFYIDNAFKSRYQHLVPGTTASESPTSSYVSDVQLQVTIGDFPDLPAAQHTFKAVSVGGDSLFVVDAISYEPASGIPATSTGSSTAGSTSGSTSGSTTGSTSTVSTSSTSSTTSGSTTQPTVSTPTVVTGNSQPVGESVDVKATDSRIVYSPPGAWKQYSNARRATSCLEGTMSSSVAGSYFTYNFTGSTIQLYTISSLNGGNYTIGIDGGNQGTYSTYDTSADLSTCPSKSLYSTTALANTQHTLVLTVQDHPSGSNQNTIQFVGFRTSPSTTNLDSSSGASVNPGAIIGGVIGGIAGLVLLVFLVIWWMRRQRQVSEGDGTTHTPDPPLHSPFTDDPFFSEARTRTESHTHSQAHWVAGSSASIVPHTPPFTIPQHPQHQQEAYYDYTAAPPSQTDYAAPPPHIEDDTSTDVDRLTYYTLPSYHENVRRRPGARDLSNADVDAISRRLQEVMRSQVEQSGGDRNSLVGVVPPRELIDHFVEEQRQPRAI